MEVFEMVVAIVALGLVAGLIEKFMKYRSKNQGAVSDGRFDEILLRLDNMEQRMRVVEEIVSSSSYDLRQEITQLERTDGGSTWTE